MLKLNSTHCGDMCIEILPNLHPNLARLRQKKNNKYSCSLYNFKCQKKQNLFNNSIKDSRTCHPNKYKIKMNFK